jgi:vacuolar protein sorting-associated protein IST1
MTTLFDVEKCSMLLKLALNRIRLQKNKKRELNEVRRREIATLLADGKEDQARVKVIALVHEDLMVEALAIVEVYCETIAVRLDIIAAQISCPLDMHESISGIIYAAPYFEHSPELAKIARMLMRKYGADFANEAASSRLINTRVRSKNSSELRDLFNFAAVACSVQSIARRGTDQLLSVSHISHARD